MHYFKRKLLYKIFPPALPLKLPQTPREKSCFSCPPVGTPSTKTWLSKSVPFTCHCRPPSPHPPAFLWPPATTLLFSITQSKAKQSKTKQSASFSQSVTQLWVHTQTNMDNNLLLLLLLPPIWRINISAAQDTWMTEEGKRKVACTFQVDEVAFINSHWTLFHSLCCWRKKESEKRKKERRRRRTETVRQK